MDILHNKSDSPHLSLLKYDDLMIEHMHETMLGRGFRTLPSTMATPCQLLNCQDGKFSLYQEKVCFGYELVAWKKFGKKRLLEVPSVKTSQDSLVLSHLCGTRNCCSPDHLVIEPKGINEERIHCHFFCKKKIDNGQGFAAVADFVAHHCPHLPKCCMTQIADFEWSEED